MPNQNVIDEYLVKLGFQSDSVSYARFAADLRDASALVDNQFLRMGKSILEFQSAIIGAFAATGAAAIGIVDKTAMADQEYRLLALHMYTSLPVARELKVALDALGQPLENVMWDPELAGRFHQLVQDQRTLTQQLGPGFENQMLRIRDVRFEFTRLGVELQYLSMNVVQDLARAFGTTIDGLLEKMRHFNAWFIANIPFFAQVIATKLKPVLIDVWNVLKSTGELIKQIGIDISQLPIQKFIHDIATSVMGLNSIESAFAKMARGDFKGSWSDLKEANKLLGPEGQGPALSILPGSPIDVLLHGQTHVSKSSIQADIVSQAKALGVAPELALAVAQIESNFQQFDKSGNVLTSNVPGSHAAGIFQLQPDTAKMLGVNPSSIGENVYGGVKYLKQLLDRYHDVGAALQHYYGSKNPAENAAYANRVLQAEATINVTVNVASNADPKKIATETAKAVAATQNQRTQRNIAEFQTPGWSY